MPTINSPPGGSNPSQSGRDLSRTPEYLPTEQVRRVTCRNASEWLQGRLRKRASECGKERDLDPRGVRTILDWLKSDLDGYQSQMRNLSELIPEVISDAKLIAIDDCLSGLLRQVKSILMTGKVMPKNFGSFELIQMQSQLKSIVVDEFLQSVSAQTYRERFQRVSSHIIQTVNEIKGIEW